MPRLGQRSLNFCKWGSIFCLFLAVIGSIGLIHHQWEQKKQLLRNEREQIQQELEQQKHLISTVSLSQNQQVRKFFTDLLRNSAEKFANQQNLNLSHHSLNFGGFFLDEKISQGQTQMGLCAYQGKTSVITLNQVYLLNKFGHNQYLATSPQLGKYYSLKIDFVKMIKTCSHELAHYLQFVKHGKSSCDSDLKLNNGKYDKELAKEHKQFSKEIYGMIKNSEYGELERKWREINNS